MGGLVAADTVLQLADTYATSGIDPWPKIVGVLSYDTPYLGPRIQLMLSQIQFKLNVEEQYLKGVEKMVQLYGMEGDRKSKADAAARRVESKQKIHLLKQALKRYEELHIGDLDSPDSHDGRFFFLVTLTSSVSRLSS